MYTNKRFIITSQYKPQGDQPQAINKLVEGIEKGLRHQTLLGATGTGKTFTMANIIARVNKPTLIIAHNKTLAAQLAAELRSLFPHNAVRYFVSYYDYYQPEAYIPKVDKYIEKVAQINQEIEKYRNAATQSLLMRNDVIIVSSVSCIYGLGRPDNYNALALTIRIGDKFLIKTLIKRLIDLQYIREYYDIKPGSFRVKGDIVDIFQSNEEEIIRIEFSFEETIESIKSINPITGIIENEKQEIKIFPSKHYVTPFDVLKKRIPLIKQELEERVRELKKEGKILEAERLKQRTNNDIEMLEETGYCTGIENYSRIIEGREPGEPGSCLLDYFPRDFLLFIDESHITIPQIRGMYFGDRSRKKTLIEYGFRLPSALDNRPLNFQEFLERINQVIYVSATPQEFELINSIQEAQDKFKVQTKKMLNVIWDINDKKSKTIINQKYSTNMSSEELKKSKEDKLYNLYNQIITHLDYEDYYCTGIAQQIIRPTGLLDPEIIVKSTKNQIQDLEKEIINQINEKSRTLIVTLTKKMAEEISSYFKEKGFKIQYLHGDIDTIERVEILKKLRLGSVDIIVGINLLREGLDLPEVSLVAILDADKEGFLRNQTSLIQIIGRAARHTKGRVIMYADAITDSMRLAIEETNRRRNIQAEYNKKHNIIPQPIIKPVQDQIVREKIQTKKNQKNFIKQPNLSKDELLRLIHEYENKMQEAANNLEFYKAAEYRDIVFELKSLLNDKDF